jgi:hypothetical protein
MFSLQDLLLPTCLSEKVLLIFRFIFLVVNLVLLVFQFLKIKHVYWSCYFIAVQTWVSIFSVAFFALTLKFHYQYRMLIQRHFEYHESLLQLSSFRGLSQELSKFEKSTSVLFFLALVCSAVNITSTFVNPPIILSTTFTNQVYMPISLISASCLVIELLLNRFTIVFFALFEAIAVGVIYCIFNWVFNIYGANQCKTFFRNAASNSSSDLLWYQLHIFEKIGNETNKGPEMPYVYFFVCLILIAGLTICFTAIRFSCLARDKDRSEHTSKILMCTL